MSRLNASAAQGKILGTLQGARFLCHSITPSSPSLTVPDKELCGGVTRDSKMVGQYKLWNTVGVGVLKKKRERQQH
jgi:hypothetical protein